MGGGHVHGENCDHGHDEYDEEDDWHLYSRNFFFDLLTWINFINLKVLYLIFKFKFMSEEFNEN
jgi:hypothetical protein